MERRARKLRVLIVEDERYVMRALKRGLSDIADVIGCATRDEAMSLLRDGPAFDVVVSDLGLEGDSGLDLWRDIEATLPRLRSRFVLMSGDDMSDAPREISILPKPFDLQEARALIERVAGPVGDGDETH